MLIDERLFTFSSNFSSCEKIAYRKILLNCYFSDRSYDSAAISYRPSYCLVSKSPPTATACFS